MYPPSLHFTNSVFGPFALPMGLPAMASPKAWQAGLPAGATPGAGSGGIAGGGIPPAGSSGGGGRPPDAFELLIGEHLEDARRAYEMTMRIIEGAGPRRNRTAWFDLDETIFMPGRNETGPMTYGSDQLIGGMIGVMSAMCAAGFRIGIYSAANMPHIQYFFRELPPIRAMIGEFPAGEILLEDCTSLEQGARLFLKCIGKNWMWNASFRTVGVALIFKYDSYRFQVWLPKIIPLCDILIDDQVESMGEDYAKALVVIRGAAQGLPHWHPLHVLEKYVEWCLEHYRSARYVLAPKSWNDEHAVRQFESALKTALSQ